MSSPNPASANQAPPRVPDFAVPRARLASILDEGAAGRLTLVVAPAGYGKSLLLSQWVAGRPTGSVAWLTVAGPLVDPIRFGELLAAQLDALSPGVGRAALATLGAASTHLDDAFIDALLGGLQDDEREIFVVIDDFDRLDGPSTDAIGRLFIEAPPHVHFVVTCRSDPSLPLHRLRADGELVQVRARELQFTDREVRDVTSGILGDSPCDDAVAHLAEITEGWPMAVRLAAVALQGVEGAEALNAFDGTDRMIVDFLSAEVFNHLDSELRSFLLDISVLDEVNDQLAAVITGRDDAARLLAALDRQGLFITRVTEERGWYRLHRLLLEFLRYDLRASKPTRPKLLLQRAAAWWLDQDAPSAAASCLIVAADWDALVELIFTYGRSAWDRAAPREVLAWVEAVPELTRARDIRLRLLHGALEIIMGRGARAATIIGRLEHEVVLSDGEQLYADALMSFITLVAGPQADSLARAERALRAVAEVPRAEIPEFLIPTDEHSLTAMAASSAARARLLLGDGGAVVDIARSLDMPEETASVARVNALGTGALADALAGRLTRAVSAARVAKDIAHHTLDDKHPASLFWRMALVTAARMRDDLDDAAVLADQALEVAVAWRRWPWAAFVLGEQALIDLAQDDTGAALGRLRQADQLPIPPPGPMVTGRLRGIEGRCRAGASDGLGLWPDLSAGRPADSWELAASAVHVALRFGRVDEARKVLDGWPSSAAPFGEIERELCSALIDFDEGSTVEAVRRASALLLRTDRDGVVGPYIEAGPRVIALLEAVARRSSRRSVDVLLDRVRRRLAPTGGLIDPLSSRELEVLRYLPTRMSNIDIAEALFVSNNTIKTHIKSIYQKLAVHTRDDAVRHARERGLLPLQT